MDLRRVMTIARRKNGELVIHNAIALDEAAMAEIEAWGTPTWLIVPNGFHRLDAPAFKKRYPSLRVICPSGSRKAVEKAVEVDGTYDDFPSDESIELQHLEGINRAEGAMIVRSESGTTLILNDIVFNMPHVPGFTGWVLRTITQSTGGPRISRVVRWFLMKDRDALRANLERLADLEGLERIIVSHHRTITDSPSETLRAVAATLA